MFTLMAAEALFGVLPRVGRELDKWRRRAVAIPDPALRRQALASIATKAFHCQGGGVLALAAGTLDLIEPIVAYQTISDYLDNLCDRTGSLAGARFRTLHLAMLDAVGPAGRVRDYYGTGVDDGGYLTGLVRACQTGLARLPGIERVRPELRRFAGLYSDLQVYKHVRPSVRAGLLSAWHSRVSGDWPCIAWWEFAAACGSTLASFALFALAARPGLTAEEVDAVKDAYFPWVCGWHILLDYLIDEAEDEQHGDFNFVTRYPSPAARREGLAHFQHKAMAAAASLPGRPVHAFAVAGLAALYLSDKKALHPRLREEARSLLRRSGPYSKSLFLCCRLLRAAGLL